jgi:hypothetical protein
VAVETPASLRIIDEARGRRHFSVDKLSVTAMWDTMWDRLDVQPLNISNLLATAPPVGCLSVATNRGERFVERESGRYDWRKSMGPI